MQSCMIKAMTSGPSRLGKKSPFVMNIGLSALSVQTKRGSRLLKMLSRSRKSLRTKGLTVQLYSYCQTGALLNTSPSLYTKVLSYSPSHTTSHKGVIGKSQGRTIVVVQVISRKESEESHRRDKEAMWGGAARYEMQGQLSVARQDCKRRARWG